MTDPNLAPPGWYAEPGTGRTRWWDGSAWGVYQQLQQHAPAPAPVIVVAAAPQNGLAIAALILGIWGFLTTAIPVFVGLFVGGIPDVLAIVFGIMGIVRAGRMNGRGMPLAVVGLILGGLGFLSIFIGAGTLW